MEAWKASVSFLWGVCNQTWPYMWNIPVLCMISLPLLCQKSACLAEAKHFETTIKFVHLCFCVFLVWVPLLLVNTQKISSISPTDLHLSNFCWILWQSLQLRGSDSRVLKEKWACPLAAECTLVPAPFLGFPRAARTESQFCFLPSCFRSSDGPCPAQGLQLRLPHGFSAWTRSPDGR